MSGQIRRGDVASEIFARHALGVRAADLSPGAVAAVKAFTLDTAGVGVAGATQPYAQALAGALFAQAPAQKARAAAQWGSGRLLTPATAAYVNAFQAHCQEFDCVHEAAVLHPFTVVVPVLLAEAQAQGMEGETYIAACAAGIDVAAGLGVAATAQIRFFRPATCGLFGAVAALARARGLSEAQAVNAFGYALAFAAGTMQAHVEGTPALAASVGAAARAAFEAVAIAEAGLPGPKGSIDGPFGYLALFEASAALQPVLDALGRAWRTEQVSWKPYPTGRAAHGGIDMMVRLRAEGVEAHAVDAIEIEAPPLIHHLVGRPIVAPLEVNYARLCLPYCAAHALRHGGVGLEAFTQSALADPVTHALAARIVVRKTGEPDPAAFTPQRATVRLKDGGLRTADVQMLLGAPGRPLSRAEQIAKFEACWDFGWGGERQDARAALIAAADGLERLPDVGVLACLAGGIDGGLPT